MDVTLLYLISDYFNDYPHRKEQNLELLRFEKANKYLHEMTIAEINAETSKWSPVSKETALKTKQKIAAYLEWLTKKCNDITIQFKVKDIVIPLKKEVTIAIYSTKDIQKYYDILATTIERKAALDGTNASTNIFKMCHAAGILAFYGLTDEQILALDLSDVQPDGVKGYNLPLTEEDINILMAYKYMQSYDNYRKLKGTKYIRPATSDGTTIDAYFLNRPLSRIELEEKYIYIKTLLKTSQLNLFGKFDTVYHKEIEYGETIPDTGKIPDWFKHIFMVSPNWLTKIRKQYVEYRDARNANKEVKERSNKAVMDQLDNIYSKIEELNKEAEKLRKQLL